MLAIVTGIVKNAQKEPMLLTQSLSTVTNVHLESLVQMQWIPWTHVWIVCMDSMPIKKNGRMQEVFSRVLSTFARTNVLHQRIDQ